MAKPKAESVISIGARDIKVSETEAAILACLLLHAGRVVTYKRLCGVLGYRSAREAQLHTLRQYMSKIKTALARRRAPCVVAVASKVGYALCVKAT